MKTGFTVLGIISSANACSLSAAMVREALKGAKEEGAAVREIYLPDQRIGYCTGCRQCLNGRCPQNDDFKAIRDELYKADGIIWGSPTYGGLPNAIMKNLIDRLGIYEASTSSLGGKYMAGIAAANNKSLAKKVAKQLALFGANGTFLRSYASGYLGVGSLNRKKSSEGSASQEKARELGRKIARDIRQEKAYPMQNIMGRLRAGLLLKPIFSKFILMNKGGETKLIYENLRERGLIAE